MSLTATERAATTLAYVQEAFVEKNAVAVLNSAELRLAVNAVDDWLEANVAGLRAALPAGVRAALSSGQQDQLLAWVMMKRAGVI